MSTSKLEHHLRIARADVKFYGEKIESEIRWLEGYIEDIRHDVEKGRTHEARNLVGKAGDVADYVGKLRSALDRVIALEDIAEEEG